MNKLPMEKRRAVIAALVEGTSINATARMTGVSKPTILNRKRAIARMAARARWSKLIKRRGPGLP